MNRITLAVLALVIALPACSKSEQSAGAPAAESVAEQSADRSVAAPATAEGGTGAAKAGAQGSSAVPAAQIPVSIPKIAYVYDFGYRLAAGDIPALQRKHADLCEKQGPTVCRILDMKQSGAEGDYASGSLALAVAAPRARAFGVQLGKLAGESGGEEVSSSIAGEDLSKQIVDTQARLRARTVLRDRLMEVLQNRQGSVSELVEAERAVAQVNEEIDEAQSWLAEMQGRVDYSRVNLSYNSGSPAGGGFMEPIRGAVGSIGMILGLVIATLIVVLTIGIPLLLVGLGVRWVWRKLRKPKQPAEAAPTEAPATV